LIQQGYDAHYSPSGHVVFIRNGSLMVVPFDLNRRQATAQAVSLPESVRVDPLSGFAEVAISDEGTLAYAPDRRHRVRRELRRSVPERSLAGLSVGRIGALRGVRHSLPQRGQAVADLHARWIGTVMGPGRTSALLPERGTVHAVSVQTDPEFRAGTPELRFEGYFVSGFGSCDISPDGDRFLLLREGEEGALRQIQVVQAWTMELDRLLPAR
jgi:hypothetical protein